MPAARQLWHPSRGPRPSGHHPSLPQRSSSCPPVLVMVRVPEGVLQDRSDALGAQNRLRWAEPGRRHTAGSWSARRSPFGEAVRVLVSDRTGWKRPIWLQGSSAAGAEHGERVAGEGSGPPPGGWMAGVCLLRARGSFGGPRGPFALSLVVAVGDQGCGQVVVDGWVHRGLLGCCDSVLSRGCEALLHCHGARAVLLLLPQARPLTWGQLTRNTRARHLRRGPGFSAAGSGLRPRNGRAADGAVAWRRCRWWFRAFSPLVTIRLWARERGAGLPGPRGAGWWWGCWARWRWPRRAAGWRGWP